MKIFLTALVLVLAAAFTPAAAQVTVEVVLSQDQFLPSESIPLAVRITNRSGQPLRLGEEPNWLTFAVESDDRQIVAKSGEVPVTGGFDLNSSQVATKQVDLAPYFALNKPGRYRVTATVRIKDWQAETSSPQKSLNVISGVRLWSQDFGVPVLAGATNGTPEVRKYALLKANYLRGQLRLYVEVSDASVARVIQVTSVGKMVSFSNPEAQLDRDSNLNLLWQSGAAHFTYARVNPDGSLLAQEIYDYVGGQPRPRLNMADHGGVSVFGGVRRVKLETMPMVKAPNELPPITPP